MYLVILILELMCIFVDCVEFGWDEVWGICIKVFVYINYILLLEVFEKWFVCMIEKIFFCYLEIIYEINYCFMVEVDKKWFGDNVMKVKFLIIEEGNEKMVCMGYLLVIGLFVVNGVVEMYFCFVKLFLFLEFDELYLGKLINVINGIILCCWLKVCNLVLFKLIDKKIGEDWLCDLDKL